MSSQNHQANSLDLILRSQRAVFCGTGTQNGSSELVIGGSLIDASPPTTGQSVELFVDPTELDGLTFSEPEPGEL